MSFLSKLFGAFSSVNQNVPLLPDIELNFIGLKGEATLKKMVSNRDYEGMKFQALKIYNDADDKYANSNKALGPSADASLLFLKLRHSGLDPESHEE